MVVRADRGKAAAAVTVVVLLGAVVLAAAVPHFAYAARPAGTPGRLLVRSCARAPARGPRYRDCAGVFRSDDGLMVDPRARFHGDLGPGTDVPVQRASSGGYELVGAAASLGWAALCCLGLLLLALPVAAVRARTGARRAARVRVTLLKVLGAGALLSALAAGVIGLANAR